MLGVMLTLRLLFDEFFIPRRIAVATTQGLRGHKVHEGDFGHMKNLNSKADGVDLIADGHALRWTKQLALRGRARFYDANGVCGKQRLVVGSDLQRFMTHASTLFPGATIRTVGDHGGNATWNARVLVALNGSQASTVTTKDLTRIIKRQWREVSRNVVTPEFLRIIADMGWRYVSKRRAVVALASSAYRGRKQGTRWLLRPSAGCKDHWVLKRRSISNAVNPQKITLFGLLRHLPNTVIDPLPNAVFPQKIILLGLLRH